MLQLALCDTAKDDWIICVESSHQHRHRYKYTTLPSGLWTSLNFIIRVREIYILSCAFIVLLQNKIMRLLRVVLLVSYFVCKYVLADQIYPTQLGNNSLFHLYLLILVIIGLMVFYSFLSLLVCIFIQ